MTEPSKSFDEMTPAERRVAVAKDVLQQIEAGKIQPTSGTYGYLIPRDDESSFVRDKAGDVDLQKAFEISKPCEACAVGSVLLATAHLFDRVSVYAGFDGFDRVVGLPSTWGAARLLSDIFPAIMLERMESCFEGFEDGGVKYSRVVRGRTESDEDEDTVVLVAIINNIVRNGGEFVPSQDL